MVKFIKRVLFWFEIIIGFIIICVVIVGSCMLFTSIFQVHSISLYNFHSIFELIMSNLLLLIIGLEMAIMMIRRDIEILPEMLAFVVSRKMLLLTTTHYELLIGVVVIAGLFAIRKYLITCKDCRRFEALVKDKDEQ